MKIEETKLQGVFVVRFVSHADERGSFSRIWGTDEFASMGLETGLNNIGRSKNGKMGTFRGMHYQAKPFEEAKLIQCGRGRIYDLALDLRKESETFGEWFGIELGDDNDTALYVPRGVAHGFQTLEDNTDVLYFIAGRYDLDSSRGVRWNDPKFGIELPLDVTSINERDANYPDFSS